MGGVQAVTRADTPESLGQSATGLLPGTSAGAVCADVLLLSVPAARAWDIDAVGSWALRWGHLPVLQL